MLPNALENTGLHNGSSMPGQPDALLAAALMELQVQRDALLPSALGRQIHAMFLRLIARTDPALSARLHDERGYRPFTLSGLLDAPMRGDRLQLAEGQTCSVRVTLLDGGPIWQCLSAPLLEEGPLDVRLDDVPFKLTRLLSTPGPDRDERVAKTSWRLLSQLAPVDSVTLSFESPTAFNINGTYFALFPEPPLVWDSLMRAWNSYAPASLHIEKQALRDFVQRHVAITACAFSTHTLRYPKYMQKGFSGRCTYLVKEQSEFAAQFTRLAAFAPFAGIGYKTTMGMGQVRAHLAQCEPI
jgi:CRISPR-associated endoribonuclease Cas6